MSEPLKPIERRIFSARGAFYEGDIFSVIRDSPYAIESFEFARADGAIDCSREYAPSTTYADRFWRVYTHRYEQPSKLLLFDIKSTTGQEAGAQRYITNLQQRLHVAFYIGVNAADPTWVEVIPNYLQGNEALALNKAVGRDGVERSKNRKITVNTCRVSTHPAASYGGIEQWGGPFRMPAFMLVEAISRIRRCARSVEVYVNPWTNVEFPGWKPSMTDATDYVLPSETTHQATACEAVMEMYRILTYSPKSNIEVDFVGLQPRLADAKFIYANKLGVRQQRFIQHKIDAFLRAANTRLSKVSVARVQGLTKKYHFSAFDR